MNIANSRPAQPVKSLLALLSACAALSSGTASAATYQWLGTTDSTWGTASNWSPGNSTIAAGAAPTGGTFAHRLNFNNAAKSEAIYTAALGNTTYTPNDRPLVIGSGALGNGTFRITGGKLSTVGSTGSVTIGNGNNSATLIVDGGEFETATFLAMGLTYGVNSTLTVNGGTATVPDIQTNNAIGTINLNGGTLAMNRIVHVGGGNTFLNFNGGTLKARTSTTAFYPAPTNGVAWALVQAGGAIIDTNGFDITLGCPMVEDSASPGGGLTKNGAGTLTLGSPSTLTGPVTINGGGLSVPASLGSWTPSSFTHSGTSLNLNLGVYNPAGQVPLNVPSLTLNSTDITLNISGSSIPASSEIRILDYGTKQGGGSLKLNTATLPANMVATLEENTTDGYYYLNVTSPSATTFNWSGASATPGSGQWDASTLNWNSASAAYTPPALVNFPNIAGGGTVEIVSDVAPLSVGIENLAGNPYSFTGAGRITGATGIAKNGTGIAIFNGAAHTFNGTLAINAGAIIKKKADDTTGNITVAADNVTLVLDGGVTDGAGQTLTISGRGATGSNYFFTGSAVQRGALQAHNGASTWQGDIVLALNDANNPNRIGVQTGASLTLTGNISESIVGASVLFRGGNAGDNITLSGAGIYSYTGRSLIFTNGASVILGATNKLPVATSIVLDSGGTTILDLNGFNQQCATLGGSAVGAAAARILNNGATPSTLTVSPGTGVTGYYQGSLANGTGILSLVKTGAGSQTLAAANSYTGATLINEGSLLLNGAGTIGTGKATLASGSILNVSAASAATVSLAGGLGGSGTLNATGKTLSVGGSFTPVALAITGNISLSANTTTSVIAGSSPATTSQTTVTGALVNNGTLTIAADTGHTFANGQSCTFFTTTGGITSGFTSVSAGSLALTNTSSGVWTASSNGLTYTYTESTATLTVASPLSALESWRQQYFGSSQNSGNGADQADFDNDGSVNLMEYALGTDPTAANSSLVSVGREGNFLTLTYTRRSPADPAIVYTVQGSSDLNAGFSTATGTTSSGTPSVYTDDVDVSAAGARRFLRLSVTYAPAP